MRDIDPVPAGQESRRRGVTEALGGWLSRVRQGGRAGRWSDWLELLGWLGILLIVAVMQGPALVAYLGNALDPQLINDDARQQIFPFFRYVDSQLFTSDYLGDYYLACLPAGYRLLLTGTALLGFDPTTTSRWLPLLAVVVTAAALAAAARRLGGKLAGLGTLALVLGCSLFFERVSGGLPRTFAFPLLALGLERLSAGRARALAVLTALGAAFYPVVAVILGFALAGMLLLPEGDRGEADGWSRRRRWLWLAGTAVACVLLLLPSTLAARRFGPVVTARDVPEVPEAGPGGRYGAEDRAPFRSYLETAAPIFRRSLVGAAAPWVPAARALLGPAKSQASGVPFRMEVFLACLLLCVAIGWTRLALRDGGARRVLLLGLAAFLGHTIARQAAPFFYLPHRYVLYVVPMLAVLLVPTGIAGLLPQGDSVLQRRLRFSLQASLTVALLVFLAGRVHPLAGMGIDLRTRAELYEAVADLPPSALIAGWPIGPVNDIPYASRRPVLLSYELHQAFHRGYVEELRARMQALTAAYLGTDSGALEELRRRWGVTHLLVDRRHLGRRPPRYFAPFEELIRRTVAERHGNPPELERQLSAATVYSQGDFFLLDLSRLLPPVLAEPALTP
jgi:hypothetical protein